MASFSRLEGADRPLSPDALRITEFLAEDYALDQKKCPLKEALETYRKQRIVSFDVPGHKQGRGNPELLNFLGKDCLSIDVNSMKPLDNLIHPVSVIKEAQELAADAFGAAHCFFMVNGTSSAVQAMVMSSVKQGEKIIMPRNVHRSAINALILSGAVPVYVDPGTNKELGIPLGMTKEGILAAIKAHPEAKAVLINNPTYYGVCTQLMEITQLAHAHGLRVLVDEAHGTHFYFGLGLPISAMAAGADMAAVSLHKTGGSLTQSSLLLLSSHVDPNYLSAIINLTQSTSASYLLMASLDITRRELALNGLLTYERIIGYADYARSEIDAIGGYKSFSRNFCDGAAFYAYDKTKLSVHSLALGLSGIEVYERLRDDFGIQIEFGDLGNFLAVLSLGDRAGAIERLIAALSEIKRLHAKDPAGMLASEYIEPQVSLSPQEAFYAQKLTLPLEQSIGHISGEFCMCYPPGIPILAPGEIITQEALDYINYAKSEGASMTGTADKTLRFINVVA